MVTTVELFVEVAIPEALSVAVMLDVEPLTELLAPVTNPLALTVATAMLDDSNTSAGAESAWLDPSL
jgi:hypothetical protein